MISHQAKKLQELSNQTFQKSKSKSKIKFICISSGKGGVGKSVISANMGYLLAKQGLKTIILDGDIGLANLDIIFNKKVNKNILHLLKGEANFEQIIININKNLDLIPSDSGEELLKYSNELIADRFLNEVVKLNNYDYMIIDTGAGIGEYVKPFLMSCDMAVIVITPEPSSITDAYAMIKSIAKKHQEIFVLLNKVKDNNEAKKIFAKISKVSLIHIQSPLKLTLLGHIKYDSIVYESIKKRVLFCKTNTNAISSKDLLSATNKLSKIMEQKLIDSNTNNVYGFFSKLANQLKY